MNFFLFNNYMIFLYPYALHIFMINIFVLIFSVIIGKNVEYLEIRV